MKRLHQCVLVAAQLFVLLACARLSAPEGWSSGALSGDVLYIGTMEGDVRALDLDNGAAIWKFQLKGEAVYGTPAIDGDRLFVSGYDGHLYGFDLQVWEAGSTDDDGALVIHIPESTTAFRVKAESGSRVGQLMVRFADDGTVEVDADDRDLVVKLNESPRPGGSPTLVVTEPRSKEPVSGAAVSVDGVARGTWTKRVGLGAQIVGSPVIANGLVLVGSSDGNLYAFDPDDPSRDWKYATGDELWSTPAVSDGVVYFGSLDHNVYAIRANDGTEVWRFSAKGAITAVPLIVDGLVYIGSFDSVFYALDAKTGEDVWKFDGASKWFWGGAVATGDAVLAPSLDGNLYVLDVRTGVLDWSYDTGGPIIGSPAIVGGMVAIPSKDHGVFLVRLRDAEFQDQCVLDGKLRASLTSKDGFIYLAANDRSIRALRVNSAGNLDEEWAHFTGEEDSVQPRWKVRIVEILGDIWNEAIIRPMVNSLVLLYYVFFSSFGLSIIVFTLIIRSAMIPLSVKQSRQMKALSRIQPKMKEVQERYRDDRSRASQETMKLYKEEGVNPLGCLGPMIIQMPIFFGLFWALRWTLPSTPERLADLSRFLYSWLPVVNQAVPLDGGFLGLDLAKYSSDNPLPFVLPILVGGSMWLLQKLTSTPAATPQQQSTNRMMLWMMPIMFGFFTLQFESGLALYWIVSNIAGIVIQGFVTGWGPLVSLVSFKQIREPAVAAEPNPKGKEVVTDANNRDDGKDSRRGNRNRPKGARRRARGGRNRRR